VFAEDRWFDILIEYAKATTEEIVIRITATNRGPDPAPLQMLPTLWFRNTWSWGPQPLPQPVIRAVAGPTGTLCLEARRQRHATRPADARRLPTRPSLAHRRRRLRPAVLATDNETNGSAVYGPGNASHSRFTKDAFHRFLCGGERTAVNPAGSGTKVGMHRRWLVPPGGSVAMHLVLTDRAPAEVVPPSSTGGSTGRSTDRPHGRHVR
jgi:hypothetical protein